MTFVKQSYKTEAAFGRMRQLYFDCVRYGCENLVNAAIRWMAKCQPPILDLTWDDRWQKCADASSNHYHGLNTIHETYVAMYTVNLFS